MVQSSKLGSFTVLSFIFVAFFSTLILTFLSCFLNPTMRKETSLIFLWKALLSFRSHVYFSLSDFTGIFEILNKKDGPKNFLFVTNIFKKNSQWCKKAKVNLEFLTVKITLCPNFPSHITYGWFQDCCCERYRLVRP